jgi:predicted ATP-dependent endonuclease of OLD family
MKISSIHVQNFRSLQKLDMDDVGDLVILVGANSSGKTNIIDALTLFFNELSPEIQRNVGSIPDYTWFDRDTTSPITFDIAIQLDKKDTEVIFPQDIQTNFIKEAGNSVHLVRKIEGQPNAAIWKTELIAVNDTIVHSAAQTNAEGQPDIAVDFAGKMLNNLTTRAKGKFIFIPAARDTIASYSGFGPRVSLISSTLLNELLILAQTSKRPELKKWQRLEKLVRKVAPSIEDMRLLESDFNLREHDSGSPFPVHWVGGGYQEVLMLLYQLIKTPDAIFAVDEPEIHLHPELARRFLDILKDIASGQQLFLTTQSPTFVDRSDLTNVWLVKKIDGSSQTTRLREIEDLGDIVLELGIRPSDIFYSNIIVFVEGPSDKVVLSILAQKMELDFEAGEISFIPTYGKSQGKYHLNTFIESTKAANIPFFMVLDKGAEKETKSFVKKGILKMDDNLFILKEGDIEDYYPRDKLIDTVCSEYNIELAAEEKNKLKEGSAVKVIEAMLEEKIKTVPRGWKIIVGEKVARAMEEDEISEELKRIIERIARKARLIS